MLESHFSQSVINIWNSLPPKIVDFSSLLLFKRTVKLVHFSSFLTRFQFLVFIPVMFCFYVFADMRACVCTWKDVNAVAYTQPCCSRSFTMCVCITVECL